MDKERALEEMMDKLGDFGRYQGFQFTLHILAGLTAGLHMLSLVTVAAVPPHRCAIPDIDTENITGIWNTINLTHYIPLNQHGELDSCLVFGDNGTTEECHSWVYDTHYYTSSLGIEWNLVCSRRWMRATAQTAFMFGVVVGSVVLGRLCDKIGRKTVYVWTGLLQLIMGTAVAFVQEYYTFLAFRFIYGVVAYGPYIAGYVMTMEIVGPTKRTICGIAFQVMFAIGIMLVAAWGYSLDDKLYLQIIYAAHSVLLLPHWILMDESPRWLWTQGRARESVAIVEKGMKMNKSPASLDVASFVSRCKRTGVKYKYEYSSTTVDLFKTRNMLKKTIIICGCWFANSVVYYGLSLNTGTLKGNPYFNIFLMGVVELPSYIINTYFLDRVGHRALISTMMLLGGLCCVVILVLPQGSTSATGVVMLGKMFISGGYSIAYKYSAELFPTIVRSSGVGLGNMFANISGALTPLIGLLDTLDPRIPTAIFAMVALVSGFSMFLLPETLGRKLPQTMEEGERFGIGDTCFSNCSGKPRTTSIPDLPETMIPLEPVEKK